MPPAGDCSRDAKKPSGSQRLATCRCWALTKKWLARCRELWGTDGQEPVEEQRLQGEECEEVRPGPECRHCGAPDMVSTGNRTAAETDAYLAYLCVLFDRMFTWFSTFDIDRSTFPQNNEAYDCLTDSVVITCVTAADGIDLAITDAAPPLPDT